MRRAALAFAAVAGAALLASSGCFQHRNDPETRAVAGLAVDLGIADTFDVTRGNGRLWLRLMPEKGSAVECELEWSLENAAAPRVPGDQAPRPVTFHPVHAGEPAGVALFEDLAAGDYRLTTFLVSARLERKSGDPFLLSLNGDLPALAPVRLAPGDLVDLGLLTLAVAPDTRYEYRARASGGEARLAAALVGREDLAAFRRAARPLAGPPTLAGTDPAFRAGRGSAGGADRRPAPPPAPPVPPPDPGPRPISGAALGVVARVAGTLAVEARRGSGLLRVEVRRVGAGLERRAVEVGWELEERARDAVPGGPRRLKLFGLGGAAARPDEIALPLPLAPGDHEIVSVSFEGSVEIGGAPQAVAASAELGRLRSFRVRTGEIVDLGVLAVELDEPRVARATPSPSADATARAVAIGGSAPGGAALVPVARPLEVDHDER
jgi:hypothetical protein